MKVYLPNLGEDFEESEIVEWLVPEGGYVEKEGDLVEIVTDKASFILPSPVSGRLVKIYAPAGGQVAKDGLLCEIEE